MRIKGALRLSAATGLALALGVGVESTTLAQAATSPAPGNAIPPMPLHAALDRLVRNSGIEIVYASDIAEGIQSKGAPAGLAPEQTLTRLLQGTGLTYQRNDSGFIILAAAATTKHPASPAGGSGIETVTVTAQKKNEDIQTVPIAVSAFTQKDLKERQIATGGDLIRDTPNMNFGKTNFSGYSIELRGIGTQAISVTTDPAVAVAFNGIPFIRNHFFEQEFFDLDNVEVLRGPQGTLYGRNATAGVVNLLSAKPTDEYQANLSADFGNYGNRRFEGMVNLPIVPDKLEIRVAGEWTKRHGYTTDTTLSTPVDGRDLWSGRATIAFKPTSDFEADLVWEHFSESDDRLRSGKQLCKTSNAPATVNGVPVPPADLDPRTIGPQFMNADYLSQGCEATSLYAKSAFEVPDGFSLPYDQALGVAYYGNPAFQKSIDPYASTTQSTNLRQIQSAIRPNYKAKNDTIELNANYTITPSLTLSSQTGYNQDFLWSTEDYNRFDTSPGIFANQPCSTNIICASYFRPDPAAGTNGIPATAAIFCDPQLGCSDRIVAQDLDVEHAWQLSQEFRLASNFEGPFNFSAGANYLHYETEENYYVFVNALSAYAVGNDVGGNASTLDQSDCLQVFVRTGGYQNPVPSLGGGEPTLQCIFIDTNPIGSLNNKGHNYFLSQNPYTLNSYAGFGEVYYNITSDLKFTGGLRWTIDRKHFTDIPSEVADDGYGYAVTGIVNQEWDRFTGRAVLNWAPHLDFTDQSMFYASYAHGYKAGGANPPGAVFANFGEGTISFPDHPPTFKPEYIEAFELGTKNTLLDETLTLNADVFYYNYTGYQISEIVDRSAINNNYNAHVEGAELESSWEPFPGLKFNFAGGLEDTGVASGQSGIDLMDRTAGMPGWMVIKPFPTQASNCILPTYVVATMLAVQGGAGIGNAASACGVAYNLHLDPVTLEPYVPNPTGMAGIGYTNCGTNAICTYPIPAGYPGFNPNQPGINNGEGFAKNLRGHKLPNTPPFTLSFGSQYTMPVWSDWTATLRGDFYWQGNSFARIFNDKPYDQLHGYTNVNLALILNSANGWQVMGYVKNVFNTTALTGDFLNSDDSGLTTNVFLTDPRLIGVRITKDFEAGEGNGGYGVPEFLQGIFSVPDGSHPTLWVEFGGDEERIAGQGQPFVPPFLANFPDSTVLKHISPVQAQNPPHAFDEEAKVSFEPADSNWIFAANVRFGRSENSREIDHQTKNLFHAKYVSGVPQGTPYEQQKFADTRVKHAESHAIFDFTAGREVGLGMFGLNGSSQVSGGMRFAQFTARSSFDLRARPDLNFKYLPSAAAPAFVKLPFFHTYHASGEARRKFIGAGPTVSWDGTALVYGDTAAGEVSFDWGANAALLFGKQSSNVRHHESGHYAAPNFFLGGGYSSLYNRAAARNASREIVIPNIGGQVGASYRFKNAKISFGYRADVFFNALDGGIDRRKSENLGFFGPFAKISIGFGG